MEPPVENEDQTSSLKRFSEKLVKKVPEPTQKEKNISFYQRAIMEKFLKQKQHSFFKNKENKSKK